MEGKAFNPFDDENDEGKSVRYTNNSDFWADIILARYKGMQGAAMAPIKLGMMAAGPGAILVFALFISNSASTLIAFASLIISLMFICYSIWMLGWILEQDIGPRSM